MTIQNQSPVVTDDIEDLAWNCEAWPEWLHQIVDKTNEVSDRLDMSSEQAIAYGVLLSRTDAQAHIAALTEKVDALMAERTNLITTKREQIAGYRRDIKTAEDRVAQLEEALQFAADLHSYSRPDDVQEAVDAARAALPPEKKG